MITTWLAFLACTILIVISGYQLSKYGDVIAVKTGLGRTWVGIVLLACATSLPELISGLSAVAIYDLPDIAVGSIMGSCMFNLLIIALIDIMAGSAPIAIRVHQGHILSAAIGITVLSLSGFAILTSKSAVILGWLDAFSIVFVALYLLGMWLVFMHEKKRALASGVLEEVDEYAISITRASVMFGLNSAIIVATALWLPDLAEKIAKSTGLGHSFIGTVLVAITTSLPELVVSISAARLGAFDMAIGNVLGSNLFNIGILGLEDAFYLKGSLLASAHDVHVVSVLTAVAMTAAVVIALTYRAEKKSLFIAWDCVFVVVLYLVGMTFLYIHK